jgi:streptogramin lyase
MRESALEEKLRKKVKGLGGWAVKLGVTYLTGIPDRLVLMPGGRIWFVEMKSEKGRLSPKQKWWKAKLTELGFEVWTVSDNEQLANFINRITC